MLKVRLIMLNPEPGFDAPIVGTIVARKGRLVVIRHDPKMYRAAAWDLPADATTGLPSGDWAWRVHPDDLPLLAADAKEGT